MNVKVHITQVHSCQTAYSNRNWACFLFNFFRVAGFFVIGEVSSTVKNGCTSGFGD